MKILRWFLLLLAGLSLSNLHAAPDKNSPDLRPLAFSVRKLGPTLHILVHYRANQDVEKVEVLADGKRFQIAKGKHDNMFSSEHNTFSINDSEVRLVTSYTGGPVVTSEPETVKSIAIDDLFLTEAKMEKGRGTLKFSMGTGFSRLSTAVLFVNGRRRAQLPVEVMEVAFDVAELKEGDKFQVFGVGDWNFFKPTPLYRFSP